MLTAELQSLSLRKTHHTWGKTTSLKINQMDLHKCAHLDLWHEMSLKITTLSFLPQFQHVYRTEMLDLPPDPQEGLEEGARKLQAHQPNLSAGESHEADHLEQHHSAYTGQ